MRPQKQFIVCDRRWFKSNIIMLGTMSVDLNVCAKLESMELLCIISSLMFHQQNENKDNNTDDHNIQV